MPTKIKLKTHALFTLSEKKIFVTNFPFLMDSLKPPPPHPYWPKSTTCDKSFLLMLCKALFIFKIFNFTNCLVYQYWNDQNAIIGCRYFLKKCRLYETNGTNQILLLVTSIFLVVIFVFFFIIQFIS